MIPLILTPEEARTGLANTLTEIRRPVVEANDSVPQAYRALVGGPCESAAAVFPDGSGTGWIASWGRGPFSAEETAREYPSGGFPCPFGAPGDLLFGQEVWRSWQHTCADDFVDDHDFCTAHCRQTYVAYEATPRRGYRPHPDRAAITYLHETTPLGRNPRLLGPWESASLMPDWASRFTFRNTGVHVERVGDVWHWVVAIERLNRPNGEPMPPGEVR